MALHFYPLPLSCMVVVLMTTTSSQAAQVADSMIDTAVDTSIQQQNINIQNINNIDSSVLPAQQNNLVHDDIFQDSIITSETNIRPISEDIDNNAITTVNSLQSDTVDLFTQCARLQVDAARLACYDKVANAGVLQVPTIKKPINLTRTVQESWKTLTPKLVLADDEDIANSSYQIQNSKDGLVIDHNDHILATVGVTSSEIGRYTPLSLAYDLDRNSELGLWAARPYNPMYILPIFYGFNPNRSPGTPTQKTAIYNHDQQRSLELKAQISFKTKVMEDLFDTNADLWLGYSQQMHWQVYNENNSRPFRATDYQPELFFTQPVTASLPFNGRLRMLGAGAIHHSNGQSDPLSRSWNRIYLMGGMEWENLSVIPKVWKHITASDSSKPSDNPDITDYYGNGELKVLYDFGQGRTLGTTGRYNFATEKGAIELDYTHPLTDDIQGFVQLFHGYGESIIDYNKSTTAIGLGVSLNDWKGL